MTWWGTQLGEGIRGTGEPKRKYRFLVELGGAYLYSLKTIDKPVATIENKEYRLINHHFSYPGTVKWNAINMTLVDFGADNNMSSSKLWDLLTKSGYSTPSAVGGYNTLEKKKLIENIGEITIYQLDASQVLTAGSSNVNYSEAWTLNNPIIEKISWGDLSYSEEDFVQYELTIKYDWPDYLGSGIITVAQ